MTTTDGGVDEFPFGGPDSATQEDERLPRGATVVEYAIWSNPDEDWARCCVCGCAGDCASYDRLSRALLLLADGSLARAAWCARMACSDERFASARLAVEGMIDDVG